MSIFTTPINSLPKPARIVLLTAADLLLVWIDITTGPFIPLTVFYIALIYVGITRVDRNWAYVVALISALGRTYVASTILPRHEYLAFWVWQFATSASVLFLICYLLDITHRLRHIGNPQISLLIPEVERAAAHSTISVKCSTRRSCKTQQTAMKFLPLNSCIALMVLSLYGGAISEAYKVDSDFRQIVREPESMVPHAADEIALVKVAVLTIDDGPRNAVIDRKILDILKRHSAKAVWFVNCIRFDSSANSHAAENLQTLLQIQHDDHLIGNHSYSHPNLRELAESDHARMVWEIEQCSSSIESATRSRPKYFRAPFGAYTPEIVRVANNAGMVYMQWSTWYEYLLPFHKPGAGDPPSPSEDEIRHVSDSVENGAIILMHDDQRTADSLDIFLSNLERRGFKFVLPQNSPEINQQS